jgi:hypothetical protein
MNDEQYNVGRCRKCGEMIRMPDHERDGSTCAQDRAWMTEQGWTTKERIEESGASIDAILDDALDKCPPGLEPLLVDVASQIRWEMRHLRNQR